jgi:hypothetical protein
MTTHSPERLAEFVAHSATLTGFAAFDLRATGQVDLYLSTLDDIVGEAVADELLGTFGEVTREAAGDEAALQHGLRRIFSDRKLGPVARALVKLWYAGTWYELPAEWRESYGESERDRTFVVSPGSYTEGLLWPAIGANPPGAKPIGYGMWATPPRVSAG